MKIGFFQFRPAFGRISYNLKQIVRKLDGVQADLIVLPELALTGYFFSDKDEVAKLAQNIKASPVIDALINLCRQNDYYLVTGFAEKDHEKYFNSAVLIGPDGVGHVYRKLHLFNDEKKWFDPGDTELSVQQVRNARIGIMICFDWIFPEVARTLAILGADIICQPANLVLNYCQQTMISRSLENNVFSVTANRFGVDNRPHGNLRFTGRSQIVAPKGELLFRGPAQKTSLYLTDIDPSIARNKMITAQNDIIADRRPMFYKSLCK